MNWKEEAVEKLRRYPAMVSAVRLIPWELKELERQAATLQAVRLGGGGVRNLRACEDRLMDNLVKRQELEQRLQQAECQVAVTDGALTAIPEPDRQLLTKLYIDKESVQGVCQSLCVDRSTLYRLRDAALKQLTLAMYGALES